MPYLDTFSGNWTSKEARHLLKRTSFGVTQNLVETAVSLGLTGTIEKLFEENSLPEPPLKYQLDCVGGTKINYPGANYGETWVNSPVYPDAASTQDRTRIYFSRNRSFYAWSFLQLKMQKCQ